MTSGLHMHSQYMYTRAPEHTCIRHKNFEVQKVMYVPLGFMVAVPG